MAGTQVASIGVGKLSSTTRYVDKFIVEIYSDSGYTVKIGQQTSAAQWNGSAWTQKDYIEFPGLVFGTTYYLRAAVIAPISGTLSSWTNFNTAAGSASAPGCTYSGTYTATNAGVGYVITPATVPSDIDHFEAIWTLDDTNVPASTTIAFWSGQRTNGTSFNLFAGGYPPQTVRLYVRAVNTSQQAQAWQLIDTRAISTVFGSGYTGTIANGTQVGTGGAQVYGTSSQTGFGGTPSANQFSVFSLAGLLQGTGNINWSASDTTPTTGKQYGMYSGSGNYIMWDSVGGNRNWLTSGGKYGVGGSPSYGIHCFVDGTILAQASGTPQVAARDTGASGVDVNVMSSGGVGYLYRNGTIVQYMTSGNQLGINGSPSTQFGVFSGNARVQNLIPAWDLVDTTATTGREYGVQSNAGIFAVYDSNAGGVARTNINSAGQFGVGMAPSSGQEFDVSGAVQSNGSAGALFVWDRTTGTQRHGLYADAGYARIWNSTGGDVVTVNRSSGNLGIGGTYTGDWISVQGVAILDSGKVLQANLANADKIAADGTSFVRVNPNQRTGGDRGFSALTSSFNLVAGQRVGGDSGAQVFGSGNFAGFNMTPTSYHSFSGDVYNTAAGTVKMRLYNSVANRQWSIGAF